MINSKKSGFTLTEILVYSAMVVLIMVAIITFGLSAIRAGVKIKTNTEVIENARRAIEVVSYEIKKSKSVYAPTSVFGSSPGQLSLEQSADLSSGEASGFVDFFKCQESLCLRRESSNPVLLTSDKVRIANLVFKQLLNSESMPSVQIVLKVESAVASALPQFSSAIEITTTVNLRGR